MKKSPFLLFLAFLTAFVGCKSRSPIADSVLSQRTPASSNLEAMEKILFDDTPGIHTDAFLILKDGKLVYYRYARGYDEKVKHLSWSMGKSIAGMIAANAIDQGKFGMQDLVSKWIPSYHGSAKIIDLFTMSSGIEFREEYSGVPVNSDATKMLYLEGPKVGFAPYTAALPKRVGVSPGDHFYYSSGDADLIMEAMKNAIADQSTHDAFPWTSFFDRLGIEGTTFEQDSTGTFVGSSYLYMTALEFARVGQLMANKGIWNGERIIPAWYFDLMTKVAPGVMKKAVTGTSPTRAYSVQTTTNLPISGRGLPSEYANLPTDSLLMIGHQGQLVIASPSENLVIVRMATDKGDPFNPYRNSLFYAVRKYLEEDKGMKIHGAGDVNGVAVVPPAPDLSKKSTGKKNYADYLKVPHLIRALYAKELCSCIFVLGRSREACDDDLNQTIPKIRSATVDRVAKTVTATVTHFRKSVAVYRGDRLGCTLRK